MKVLMLGWEFPPHISGGLGTACFGMTQGLAAHGVQTIFVVPRALGDEDGRFARILGADQVDVPLPGRAVSRPKRTKHVRPARSPARRAARRARLELLRAAGIELDEGTIERWLDADFTSEEGGPDALESALRVLAVDSPLRPYLDESAYARELAEAQGEHDSEQSGEHEFELRPQRAAWRAAAQLRDTRALLANPAGAPEPQPWADEPDVPVQAGAALAAGRPSRRMHFSGHYGPDLLAEVARYALAVAEIAQRESFDLIHAHDWMTYPAGLVAKHVSGKPLVAHMHACEFDRSGEHPNQRIRDIEQAGISGADLVVCVSHYTANVLRRWYQVDAQRLRVVHNAVTHREQKQTWHQDKQIPEPIVLFLGRVTFQKGPDYFIEAAARVIKLEPRVKFVLGGSGDMLAGMIERAARLGLARHVHFTGFLRGKDVERMYAMADIYVMPSVSEPFGISPLEAMALDTPVILSRQSGVSEVLTNALKVDFWDVEDIANKILALLKYPALSEQLTEDGKEEVRRLRWDHQGAELLEVFKELVP